MDFEGKESKKTDEREMLIGLSVLLLSGIILDVLTWKVHPFFLILNYESICLMVVPLQATISTLVITILSFMTSKMDARYLGVSVNDFLLQCKPRFFKQKSIFIGEIVLTVLGVFTLMFQFYNAVISIFLVSVCLIIISINGVYEVFLGTEKLNEEIRKYVLEACEESGPLTTELMVGLCEQWKGEIACQTEAEYQEYVEVFNRLFLCLFLVDKSREKLVSCCRNLCGVLLRAGDQNNTLRGLALLEDCYIWAESCISHAEQFPSPQTGFNLLHAVLADLEEAVPKADIRAIEHKVNWTRLCDDVIYSALFLGKGTEKDQSGDALDLYAVKELNRFLGGLVARNAGNISTEVWKKVFVYPGSRYARASMTEQEPLAEKVSADCSFCFLVEQAKSGYYDLIRLRYQLLDHLPYRQEDGEARSVIKLHCYLYYLACFETPVQVDQRILDAARSFLNNKETATNFREFIEELTENDAGCFERMPENKFSHDIFNASLEDWLYSELKEWEIFWPNVVKRFCMEDAVRDFVVYLSCFIGNMRQDYTVLDSVIPGKKASSYYLRYITDDCPEAMEKFFELMTGRAEEDISVSVEKQGEETGVAELQTRVQAAYAALTDRIREKYKSFSIRTARERREETEEKWKQQKELEEQELAAYLQKSFSGLMEKNLPEKRACGESGEEADPGYSYQTCRLWRCTMPMDVDLCQILHDGYDSFFIILADRIISRLQAAGLVDQVYKKSMTDPAWQEFLDLHQDEILLGSESAFYPKDFFKREDARLWIAGTEHYVSGVFGDALLLKKDTLKLDFRKVSVVSRPETLKEIIKRGGAVWNPETGMYRYGPGSNMPVDFTGEELMQYLQDSRQVVVVSVEAGMRVMAENEKIGTVILAKEASD